MRQIMQVEVTNIVKLFGTKNELSRLRKYVDTNGLGFEFNDVIKQPPALIKIDKDEPFNVKEEIQRLFMYGAVDILEWRRNFWGTEWQNLGTEWNGNNYFKMITMNTSPLGIFRQLTVLFEVTIHVVFADDVKAGIYIIKKGNFITTAAKTDEVHVVTCLLTDPNYTYKMWKGGNLNSGRSKRLDMELLFKHGTPFLKKVRGIVHNDVTLTYKEVES